MHKSAYCFGHHLGRCSCSIIGGVNFTESEAVIYYAINLTQIICVVNHNLSPTLSSSHQIGLCSIITVVIERIWRENEKHASAVHRVGY